MMNLPPRTAIASVLGLVLVAMTALVAVPPHDAEAQVSALPLDFADVVVFGTNSVKIEHNAQVTAGHVVVNNASAGPTLNPGVELGIDKNVVTPAGYAIVADSIDIAKNAVVNGNAFYNSLSNAGTINGSLNTPLLLPVFAPLPPFHASSPGALDVTVPQNGTQTIAPGSYRDVTLAQNATLRFSAPGVYNVRSITTGKNAQLLFENLTSGTADVRVLNQVLTGANNVVGPDDDDPLKADKIIVYVGFSSGATLSPAAVDFGKNTVLKANVYAPSGTLILGENVVATGAFLARDVEVQKNAQVDLETFFSQQAPIITSPNATTFTVGQAGTFTVTTTGTPTPSIMQGGALPSGVSFVDNGDGTGTLSGTPAAGTGGTYALTFTASNGVPPAAMQNFTLTVNQAPTITSANATTFTVGQADSFTVTTTGFPAPSITRGGVALPSGVSFTDNGNGTGTLSGTPAAGTGGTYAITFTATNVAGSSPTQNFTLTVNQAPAITSANATTFTVGQFDSFTVTTTGFPTASIAQGGALPAGVSFIDNSNGTGTLSGTPAAGTGGIYPLTFTASNGVPPNAFQNFTLTVTDPPVAANDGPYVTDANTTFSRATSDPDDLLDNDDRGFPLATITSFGGGSLGGSVTSNAAGSTATFGTGGSLTVQSDGAFSFTPSAGFTGVFTFQYRLTNSAGNSDATVTIHVRPRATNDTFGENVVGNVVVDTSTGTVFSVLTNDVFNGPVTVNLVGAGSANGGAVSLSSSGTFVYNPPVGFEGLDTFTYTITDASGFTSTPATVSLTVSGMIWFVNNNAGACVSDCDGRLTNPLTTLQAFTSVNDGVGAHPANGDNVFVYESPTVYTFVSGTLLQTGQKLIGQDATSSLAAIAGVSLPSGSSLPAMNSGGNATTIASTVTLAASSTVRGLTISTGVATGLNDPAGAIAGVTVSETIVSTTTGTAVSLTDVGGTVSLIRVSATGAASGVVLANTTGSFTVTGSGGSCTSAATCTGGAIQNTTSHGLSLTNAQGVSLTRLFVGATGGHGINTSAVNGLTLANSVVKDAGNADNEYGLHLVNVAGTVAITGTTFDNAADNLVTLTNNNVNAALNVTGSQFSYPAVVSGTANSAFLIQPGGTAAITVAIQNNTFTNVVSASAQIGANLAGSSGTQNFTFSDNTVDVTLPGRSGGVIVSGQESTKTNITIADNDFSGAGGNGVISIDTNDTSTVQGTVTGNVISNPPAIGMFIAVDEAGTNRIVVDGNTITNAGGDGIQTVNFGGAGLSNMQLAVTNNAINGHSLDIGQAFVGGIASFGFEDTFCLALRGNTVTGTPVSAVQCGGAPCVDYYLEEIGGTMTLEEVPDTAATVANAAYINSINDPGPVTVFGIIDLTNGATCSTTPVP